MRSTHLAIALAILPCACVIDGVPLPDETDRTTAEDDENSSADSDSFGDVSVYATRSSGVTVVFGVPASAPAGATIVARSGVREARTVVAADGSFNLALIGQLDSTVIVQVVQSTTVIAQHTLATPISAELQVPNGSGAGGTPVVADASSVTVDADTAQFSLPAGSFASNAAIAIANLDLGATSEARADSDGGLVVVVEARGGDTLYIVAITDGEASAPYVLTAP